MTGEPQGMGTQVEALLSKSPARDAYTALHELLAVQPVIDPRIVELCRIRSAMLMALPAEVERRNPGALEAGLDETTIKSLALWPSSPLFDDRTRAALRFTEAFLFGTDQAREELANLRAHFTDAEVFALGAAVAFHESFHLLSRAVDGLPATS